MSGRGGFLAGQLVAPNDRASTRLGPDPSFLESAAAAFRTSMDEQDVPQLRRLTEAYEPVLDDLRRRGVQVAPDRTDLRTQWSFLTGSVLDVSDTVHTRAWAAIDAARKRDPQAFAQLPSTQDEFERQVLSRHGARAQDQDAASRGGLTAQLAGGAVASFLDPVTIATMPIGGGGKTILQTAARELLANTVTEAGQQIPLSRNRERMGETLTAGEAALNIGAAGLAGGVLGGAVKGVELHVPAAWQAVRARVRAGETVPDNELADAAEAAIGRENMTQAEADAVAQVRRSGQVDAVNPFVPNGAGAAAHNDRLLKAMDAVLVQEAPSRLDQIVPLNRPSGPTRPISAEEAAVRNQTLPWEQVKSRIRRHESQGDDGAKNARSSATGRYQVIDSTWLRIARRYPETKGATDAHVLSNRSNPAWQERVMDALGAEYRAALAKVGAPETTGNLYLMHFAGEGGASKILRADPDAPIEQVLSHQAIAANGFLRGKSVAETIAWAHEAVGDKGPRGPVLDRARFDQTEDWAEAQRAVDADAPRERVAEVEQDDDWVPGFDDDAPAAAPDADPFAYLDEVPAARSVEVAAQPMSTETVRATVAADAVDDFAISSLSVKERGEPGVHLEPDSEGHMVNAVFRDADGRARGAVLFPASDELRAFRRAEGLPVDVVSYVDPAFRRQGIATKLYDKLRDAGYDVDTLSGSSDLTPNGAAFVNARRSRAAAEPAPSAPALLDTDRGEAATLLRQVWAEDAMRGKPKAVWAARPEGGGDLAWWSFEKRHVDRMVRSEPGLEAVKLQPPADLRPATIMDGFDHVEDQVATVQVDSLEHDMRMIAAENPDMEVWLDESGPTTIGEILKEFDDDMASIEAARACMAPHGAREA